MKERLDIENIEEVECITQIHADHVGQFKKDTEYEYEDNEDFEEYTQRTY